MSRKPIVLCTNPFYHIDPSSIFGDKIDLRVFKTDRSRPATKIEFEKFIEEAKRVKPDGIFSGYSRFRFQPLKEEFFNSGGKENLKIICIHASGANSIDVARAKKEGVCVCNTPIDLMAVATSEITMFLIITTMRKIHMLQQAMESGDWKSDLYFGNTMLGKTVGIIGFGSIGKLVARKCQSFGMKVLYTKRNRLEKSEEQELDVEYASLNELLEESDVVSIHVPLSPRTTHLIGKKELELMKKSAYLINMSRGKVVNEEELIKALKNGVIRGAGLDVFNDEPLSKSRMLELKELNCVLTPHIGTQAVESRRAMETLCAKNLYRNMIASSIQRLHRDYQNVQKF